jgi:putative hydrolase of the HAD superfamily
MVDRPASDDRYKRRRIADFGTILAEAGVKVTGRALDRGYHASGAYLGRVWSKNKDVPVVEHVRAILTAIDRGLPARISPPTLAALVDAYAEPALLVPPLIDSGARPALERLRADGIVLALVSNTMRTPGATLRKVLDRFGLLACFAHTTFSDEVGVRKPDPEIFALTLNALGVEPSAAVHVGDDPVLDVYGAREAGLRVVQVTGTSPTARDAQRPDAVVPSLAGLPEAIAALERA